MAGSLQRLSQTRTAAALSIVFVSMHRCSIVSLPHCLAEYLHRLGSLHRNHLRVLWWRLLHLHLGTRLPKVFRFNTPTSIASLSHLTPLFFQYPAVDPCFVPDPNVPCKCPLDRMGDTCQTGRPFSCNFELQSPLPDCPPPSYPESLLDGDPPCFTQYEPPASRRLR